MPGDEEFHMSDTPFREPPPSSNLVYSRPPIDGTDEEIDAWASDFVDTVLGTDLEEGGDAG